MHLRVSAWRRRGGEYSYKVMLAVFAFFVQASDGRPRVVQDDIGKRLTTAKRVASAASWLRWQMRESGRCVQSIFDGLDPYPRGIFCEIGA